MAFFFRRSQPRPPWMDADVAAPRPSSFTPRAAKSFLRASGIRGRRALVLLLLSLAALSPPAAAKDVRPADVQRLLADPSPSVRASAVRKLAGSEKGNALAVVVRALADRHPYVRSAAAGVLGQVLGPKARRGLRRRLARLRTPEARAAACEAYRVWADADGAAGLQAALEDDAPEVRIAALRVMHDVLPAPGVARLAKSLADRDARVRAAAIDAWVAWRTADAALEERVPAATWKRLAVDPDSCVRIAALEGSVALGADTAKVAVARGLTDAVWSVRMRAAELSVRNADRHVVEQLVATLDDARRRVRDAAHRALVELTGIPFEPVAARWRTWLDGDGKTFDPAAPDPEHDVPRRPRRRKDQTVEAVRFLGVPLVSRHIVFVLDASGSMRDPAPGGPTRWDAARAELDKALSALSAGKDRVRVGVVRFADGVHRPFDGLRLLTPALRRTIDTYLAKTRPAGRTALYDGVAAALTDPAVGQVVVLSDGAPSAGQYFTKTALLAAVRRANRFRRARIDVVSVGGERVAKRWRDVLKRMTEAAGGRLIVR